MVINVIFYSFSGITDNSSQPSDLNGNRNTKTFPYPRDGPYIQLSESHEHQLYYNRYVSIILRLLFLLNNYVIYRI